MVLSSQQLALHFPWCLLGSYRSTLLGGARLGGGVLLFGLWLMDSGLIGVLLEGWGVLQHRAGFMWGGERSGGVSFSNPQADIDLSAATDADDLVVFLADAFEFVEHEQALLLDSLVDLGLSGGAGLIAAGGVLSVRALKRL